MKRFWLIFLLLLMVSKVQAVAYQSNGTGGGLWHVAASWAPAGVPGAADTVDILVGDTITIDGNISVGNTAGNDTTYNINIQGNLVWPQTPGGNWTFSPSSSIRLQGVGKFYIGCTPGAPTDRLNCANYAIVEFQTGGGIKYDLRIDGASAQLIARGCEGYHASAGTETRARITACNPDCNAGANKTLTLDTDVNWQAVTNPVTVGGTGNPEVLLGSGGSDAQPGWLAPDWRAELTEIDLFPAANQVRVTNLAKSHVIGDMIVNPTKNILFKSSNAANHGSIYSVNPSGTTLSPFGLSWVRLDEMGDGQTATTAAIGIDLNAVTSNWGTIEYTWVTNCEDGGNTNCFYILEGDFDSFDWNGVHDALGGYGVYLVATRFNKTITGYTAIDMGGTGIPTGYGFQTTTPPNISFDQMWCSNVGWGLHGGAQAMTNSIFHHTYLTAVATQIGYTWERHRDFLFKNNEIRNSKTDGLQVAAVNAQIINNLFFNIQDNCIDIVPGVSRCCNYYSADNTFDNCNSDVTLISEGAINITMRSGLFYSQNDDFGSTVLNEKANILVKTNRGDDNTKNIRIIFNESILNGPNNPTWGYPIYMITWDTDWRYRYAHGPNSYVTLHNKNQVAGAHWGFGPGGMIIEHVTGAGPTGGWIDNTVNMKVIPFAGDRYCRIHLGKVSVEKGDVLQVNLQIQKNQAIANGRRPRLVLKGSGFDPTVDYDEMADVNNSWDTVTVSGTATYSGGVHAYLEVLNDLAGDPSYPTTKPVDPPTIIIYADGSSWNKS